MAKGIGTEQEVTVTTLRIKQTWGAYVAATDANTGKVSAQE